MRVLDHSPARTTTAVTWYDPDACRLDDFRRIVEVQTRLEEYPHADAVADNVLLYGAPAAEAAADPAARRALQSELAYALMEGPGVVVFKSAFNPETVDAATDAFHALIAEQKAAGTVAGDHFAKPGANDRIWGALDKLAVAYPEVFVHYYANDALALVSEAWLGANYQVTSQVNVVNPGGQAQVAHRDYHLGFMSREQTQLYPAHTHTLSPVLTLQGAVAHVDMPVETGPTMFLPHSQKYGPGYVAYHDPAFTAYFDEHFVQLPLEKGDAVFFSPALFHGAGTNHTPGVARMANLLQVSSAFGRAMETVDTTAICKAVYPVLRSWDGEPRLVDNVVTVAAEGYAFPTNLDRDQPVNSLTPQTQADLLRQALAEGWDPARLATTLDEQGARRR
ncbi:MAG: phytanoyl-CoA dioxygenase family protein [Nocardioidaceae bacterium]